MAETEDGQRAERTGRSGGFGRARRALTQEVIRGSERAAWLVLQAVNRVQAKGTTVRLVAPRDPDIVDELGRELGLGPTDEELLSAEDYLLEHGYIAPTGLGVTRNVYTVTRAGLDWLEADLTAPRGKSQQEPSEEAQRRETRPDAPGPLGQIPQHAEEVGSITVLRGERDRLLQELEEQRLLIERLETELGRRRSPWYERWFG
jgi:DNA-binding PadR family transcriptional regulator